MTPSPRVPRTRGLLLLVLGGAALIALLTVAGVAYLRSHMRVARQPNRCMEPTIPAGSLVWWSPSAYDDEAAPQRWDLVVLRSPNEPSSIVVRRIVALPLEDVHIRDGVLHVDGSPLELPEAAVALEVIDASRGGEGVDEPLVVPPWQYFVLGDNTGGSVDSREYGPVRRESILGKVTGWQAPE